MLPPQGTATVSVHAINVAADSSRSLARLFLEPVTPGRETMANPHYAFLIEHAGTGRRIMFDLGARKDMENFAPAVKERFLSLPGFNIKVEKDVVEQLQEGNVYLDTIDTVIWSHTHLDHTGDMSKFPPSTKLVLGPGSDKRTYPTVNDAMLLDSDFFGRDVQEISFEDSSLNIAGRPTLDFFGDGSLYLFDMPGHCPGHISALARVKPDSFVLLGGDSCHHPAQIRPNAHIHVTFPCPGHILDSARQTFNKEHFSPEVNDSTTPLLGVPPPPSAYADREKSLESQRVLGELDAHPDVFVVCAHDASLVGVLDLFPECLDDWKEKGWKEKAVWAFMDEKNRAFRFN
ncbi:metallo-beta-lactamase superfamily protein [Moniliophthora roreri MCA 2997]|uniref:Metallo-beta-lactamase superfamily protein n=2 Tax=Moniliophthora roreri TaxID=221103 RepID=V2XD38_MONRO|nr:metallo-beta-lactamase superfamily protein [Moniliophthora roreri MCA 2997]KAI3600733.1 metallo-beta-lactamase superfamily protein [Moniliophthora roreri]